MLQIFADSLLIALGRRQINRTPTAPQHRRSWEDLAKSRF